MKERASTGREVPLRLGRGPAWALLAALGLCALLPVLQWVQRQTLERAVAEGQVWRMARVDLAEGFLEATLADAAGGGVFRRAEGLARVEQAVRAMQAEAPVGRATAAEVDLTSLGRELRREFEAWEQQPGPERLARVRLAYHRLKEAVTARDLRHARALVELSDRHHLQLTLATASVVTLVGVVLGLVIRALRGRAEAERQRAEAERALQENQQRFAQIVGGLPQLTWTCTAEGGGDFFSLPWVRYTGRPAAEQLGFAWLEQVHPEDRPELREAWHGSLRAGTEFQREFRLRRHDGVYRWFDTRAIPLRDDAGRVVRWFGSNTDVTEQRALRAELEQLNSRLEARVRERTAQLRESEERMRLVGDHGTDGFWDWDLLTGEEYLSPSFKALFGYADDELPNRATSWQRIIHPEDLPRAMEAFRAHTEEGAPFALPVRYRHKDGSIVWVVCRGVALRDASGRWVRMVGTHQDITALKHAEAALHAANESLELRVAERTAALRESEARQETVIDNLEEGLVSADLDGRMLHWNTAALRLHGLTREELRERLEEFTTLFELRTLDGVVVPTADWPLARVARGEKLRNHEIVLHRIDKAWDRIVSYNGTQITDPTGRILSLVSAVDITARKQAEQALRESEARFARGFLASPVPLLLMRQADEALVEVNEAFLELVGHERAAVIGRSPRALGLLAEPEAPAPDEARPSHRNRELVVQTRIGSRRHVLASSDVVDVGGVAHVLATWFDVTARRRAEQLRAGQSRVLEMIARQAPLAATLTCLVELLEAQDESLRCSVLLFDEAGQRLLHGASPSLPTDYNEAIHGVRIGDRVGSCGTAAFLREPVFVEDIRRDPRWEGYRPLAARIGALACWSTPVIDAEGRLLGTLALYRREPGPPTLEHRRLIDAGTYTAAICIGQLRAAQAMRESEARYRLLAEHMADVIWVLDVATLRFLYVSPSVERLRGYTAAEAQAQSLAESVTPASLEKLQALIPARLGAFEAGDPTAGTRLVEVDQPCRDGSIISTEIVSTLLRDPAGRLTVIGVSRDVTERRRLRRQLERQELMLREAGELAHVGGWEFDPVTATAEWTHETARIHDLEAAGARRPGYGLEFHTGAARDQLAAAMEAALRDGTPYDLELELTSATGRQKWVRTIAHPVLEDGRVVRVRGSLQDISARRRIEDELRQLNNTLEQRVAARTAALEAANRELEAFSYSISHDLRAPLRAVDGFSTAVLEDYGTQLPAEAQRYLGLVKEGAQRMGELIDDLLTFSRLSRLPLCRSLVDMGALVREAWELLGPERAGRAIELRLGELPPGEGDASLLRQVWVNLLSNACKYSRGRAPALLTVEAQRGAGGEVVYAVRDNGAGFDMAYAHKLFGVFQRLHRAEEFEGTGVGLAIVQRVVHRHGGRVWAESRVGQGATFLFTLGPTAPSSP